MHVQQYFHVVWYPISQEKPVVCVFGAPGRSGLSVGPCHVFVACVVRQGLHGPPACLLNEQHPPTPHSSLLVQRFLYFCKDGPFMRPDKLSFSVCASVPLLRWSASGWGGGRGDGWGTASAFRARSSGSNVVLSSLFSCLVLTPQASVALSPSPPPPFPPPPRGAGNLYGICRRLLLLHICHPRAGRKVPPAPILKKPLLHRHFFVTQEA